MFDIKESLEDAIVTELSIEEYIKKFDPEIQKIFYDAYGENLETIPKKLLGIHVQTEEVLEGLLKLGNARFQKIILMRFGIVTGSPMTLQEVANELGITRERARLIEKVFLSRSCRLVRRKKLVDYLND